MGNYQATHSLKRNKELFAQIFSDCADIKMIDMTMGIHHDIQCMVAYIEITFGKDLYGNSMISKLVHSMSQLEAEEIYRMIDQNLDGLLDVSTYEDLEEAAQMMLTGDLILLVEGYAKAFRIPDKGFPYRGAGEAQSEKVIRGTSEAFSDSIKINTALIRRRVRALNIRVKEMTVGVRSQTKVNLMYMSDLVRPEILSSIEEAILRFQIDGILDSGMLEQLTEDSWYSPFPQFQTTERPDQAAFGVLNGRVVVICDNSPIALILPSDIHSFMQTSDDYYNRFQIASFERIIRYLAAFLALCLPGLYLAVLNYHTQMLPTNLLLTFAQARVGVPFSSLVEILLMELSFELLREAGVRLPGTMSNTIGIVGGLIIGSAAVEAGLISPVVVIVVAFTALCSFAIPSEEFATSFRILKFLLIFLGAWLGYFGWLVGLLAIGIHLSHLKSFGIPYLMPFAATTGDENNDQLDAILRMPLFLLKRRPFFTKDGARIRFRRRG